MDTSYPKLTPSGKRLLVIVGVIAIIIPILLTYVLIYPLNLPTTISTARSSSATSSGSSSALDTIILPSGVANSHSLNFQPASLSVASGTTITFVDQDSSTHNVDFTSVPQGATTPAISPDLKNGDTFQVTLTTAGTYRYQCDYHSGWMQGTITVTG